MSSFTEELEYEFTGSYYKGNPQYVITKAFTYRFGDYENPLYIFRIPEGFITDLCSIPWPCNMVLKPEGPWAKAGVLHDYIYSNYPQISKVVADSIFLEGMLVLEINPCLSYIFFILLRTFQLIFKKY